MSTNAPRRPRANKGKCTFQIVASQFNSQYVRGLVDHAEKELRSLASSAAISIHRVPGSFEIPVVVRELARKKNVDAFIACGVIMLGETNHTKHIRRLETDEI